LVTVTATLVEAVIEAKILTGESLYRFNQKVPHTVVGEIEKAQADIASFIELDADGKVRIYRLVG
jgi:hypothetical protein